MPYDITKLTNLGQMKQALERMLQEINNSKSTRTVVTVASTSWQSYSSGIYRSGSILETSNYNYYDVHLTSDTSKAISIMCANAEIKAKIESNNIYLYCYGEVPESDFDLEIIITPIDTSTQGLNYDIGDDYLVYPAITDAISTRVDGLEETTPMMILFANNVAVDSSKWVASEDTTYPYKAVINMQNVTENHFPIVQFNNADVADFEFSSISTSGEGTITIMCKTAPDRTITLPSIICYKGTVVTTT